MSNREFQFESQELFQVIQQVWLGLLAIFVVSLAISSLSANQQAIQMRVLSMCLVTILLHMGYLNYQCCRFYNIKVILNNTTLTHLEGEQKTSNILKDLS